MCGMDVSELKKMLKNSTAVLIMDNGDPSFVVVNYDTYKDLVSKGEAEIKVKNDPEIAKTKSDSRGEVEMLERINKDILALKAQIEEEEKGLGID